MTPGARVQAAIEVLETYLNGTPLEQALTRWARASRFAGSKDRAALRDLVYQAVRRRRSGGAWPRGDARLWIARVLAQDGADLSTLYSGSGHAPTPLSQQEWQQVLQPPKGKDTLDAPDWVIEALGGDILAAQRDRAPITVRVNVA
ncbi:MAG: RsmB/NOP family class I SAM-dependent RNA methyltransferase, partial [Pseudomonadota bacterium]